MNDPLDRHDFADRLLSLVDVAERLTLSLRTVQQLVADGRLPAVRIGRRVAIHSADLRTFVDCRRERRVHACDPSADAAT